MARDERKLARRLDAAEGGQKRRSDGPELAGNPRLDLAERTRAMPYGGVGTMLKLARHVGLMARIDDELDVLKCPHPYTDADHVMNIALNILCGGRMLDDIEIRRQDLVFLDALGARSIPDPTTAGDYCRRFDAEAVLRLMLVVNDIRVQMWRQQGPDFLRETARIDADGSLVPTTGECKEGMDVTYKGTWGYHPLLVSLANTQEPLFLLNRSGNRPSYEHAAHLLDASIELCRRAGFEDILLRGDTDFSQTEYLDGWDADGVRFVFGYDAHKSLVKRADQVDEAEYRRLEREANRVFEGKRRAKQPRIKEQIVRDRGFKNLVLSHEDLAEFDYRPTKAAKSYRMIALRKTIDEERGQLSPQYPHSLFLLHHERPRDERRAGRPRSQPTLQPGAPHRAAQERRPRAARAPQHAQRELGLYGDRLARLDAQGVVRAAPAHLAPLARAAPRPTRPDPTHGVPHLRAEADVDPGSGPADRPPPRLPRPGVAARPPDPLPPRSGARLHLTSRPARRTGAWAGRLLNRDTEP